MHSHGAESAGRVDRASAQATLHPLHLEQRSGKAETRRAGQIRDVLSGTLGKKLIYKAEDEFNVQIVSSEFYLKKAKNNQ